MPKEPELTEEERVAAMDAQVALNRATGCRSGGNTVEPGQYDPRDAEVVAIEVVPETLPNEATEEAVAAMDAQVAAANGGAAVQMSDGVQTSAPSEAPAPARRSKSK